MRALVLDGRAARAIACIACAVLAGASGLVAQSERLVSEQASPDADRRCIVTSGILNTPMVNAPFSADATTAWQPPASKGQSSLRATARYSRDSQGRVRVEQRFVGDEWRIQRIILAPEAGSRTAHVIDPVARTVSTPVPRGLTQLMVGDGCYIHFVLPRSRKHFTSFMVPPDGVESTSDADAGSLGERTIAGIRVTGSRFATWLPGFGTGRAERWVSEDLGLPVYTRSVDGHFGILEYELTNISRSDPPAELFEVPEQYTEIPFEYPVSWAGPYTPERSNTK